MPLGSRLNVLSSVHSINLLKGSYHTFYVQVSIGGGRFSDRRNLGMMIIYDSVIECKAWKLFISPLLSIVVKVELGKLKVPNSFYSSQLLSVVNIHGLNNRSLNLILLWKVSSLCGQQLILTTLLYWFVRFFSCQVRFSLVLCNLVKNLKVISLTEHGIFLSQPPSAQSLI